MAELKIREMRGYYALDIPNCNGNDFIFSLFFNSKRNAETVGHIIKSVCTITQIRRKND